MTFEQINWDFVRTKPVPLGVGRFDMSEEHPPHSLIGFLDDVGGLDHRNLPHERQGKAFEASAEVFAASFPRRLNAVNFAAFRAAPTGHIAEHFRPLTEDIQKPPGAGLAMVVASDATAPASSARTRFLLP